MRPISTHLINSLIILLALESMIACAPIVHTNDYLLKICDSTYESCGFVNQQGEIVIPLGKYAHCFTDTFHKYAIVTKPSMGFLAIDRQETVLYEVFPYDNGPDTPSDGLFRIRVNNKIGFADAITGSIVIPPQYECAWPFENGVAAVSVACKTRSEGEHSTWISDHWFYIDKKGNKVEKPKSTPSI